MHVHVVLIWHPILPLLSNAERTFINTYSNDSYNIYPCRTL